IGNRQSAITLLRRSAAFSATADKRLLQFFNRQSTIENRQLLVLLLPPNVKPRGAQSQQPQGGRSQRGNGRRRTVHLGNASVCNWAPVAGTNRCIGLSLVSVARQRSTVNARFVEPRPAEVRLPLDRKF